jgi:NAD-reducing hydrogenase small subunit
MSRPRLATVWLDGCSGCHTSFLDMDERLRSPPTSPACANPIGPLPLPERSYLENATDNPRLPSQVVPKLLPAALPVHRVVEVDVFLPGCPPSADLIYHMLDELLGGRMPDTAHRARFGA